MKAIILAAGRSKRIQPPIGIPKAMIRIDKKTLLEHSLSNLKNCGINKVIIVVGYLGDKIIEKLGNEYEGIKIKYIKNDSYDQTDNLYSLWLAKSEFNDDILYMDADILYDKRILKKLTDSNHENIVLVGNMQIDTGEEIKVFGKRGVAKKIGRGSDIQNNIKEASLIGEAIGIVKISSKYIKQMIENMDWNMKNKKFSMSHEDLTQTMCEKNLMNYVSIGDLPWIEIDFHEDILKAEKEVYPKIRTEA